MVDSDSDSIIDAEDLRVIIAARRKLRAANKRKKNDKSVPPEEDTDTESTLEPDEVAAVKAAGKKMKKKRKMENNLKNADSKENGAAKEISDRETDSTLDPDEVEGIITADKENDKNSGIKKKKPVIPKVKKLPKVKKRAETHVRTRAVSDSDSDPGSAKGPTTPSKAVDSRSPCKYGDKCFRKNPEHLKAFFHKRPINEGAVASTSGYSPKSPKKMKVNGTPKKSSKASMKIFGFFFTTVQGISQKYNDAIAYGVKDLLSMTKGKLKASAQFNYMFDIPWLIEQYPAEFRNCPLTVVHGEQRKAKESLEKSGAMFSNVKFCQAKLDIPYGTHHTKMMFLLYEEGLKIIIHTSNMVSNDWAQKTQGMWVSHLFPKLNEASLTEGESVTKFKADIVEYVSAYGAENLEEWCTILKQHDMSGAKVFVIGSVPGRHMGSKKTAFGHLKLRKVLHNHGAPPDLVSEQWPIVGQFSSIGSLGTSADQWMCGEWLASLSTIKGKLTVTRPSALKLVYPSVENVRLSLEGYPAGASLPYSIKVASKQPYLKAFMHQWKSERFGRSAASPHVKSYLRLSPSSQKIAWFLVSSANLSKAAWGCLEKKDSQFMIRSFEIGVLFIPEYFDKELFDVPSQEKRKDVVPFPVPFDLPVTRYNVKEEPWIWDIPHVYAPDRNGNKWCPP